MMKKLILILTVLVLVLCSAFDLIYTPEEMMALTELPLDPGDGTEPEEDVWIDVESGDAGDGLGSLDEQPVQPVPEEPTAEIQPEPVYDEPITPAWQDIDEDQVDSLRLIYQNMTNTGKAYSGWFADGNYAPCTWNGIRCENGRVTGLTFENAGYFTTFPEAIMGLWDLKELHMVDTLVRGPLPEDLFEYLQKLEVLELSGNFLTGEIPALADAFSVYPMLREIKINDNLEDNRKAQLLWLPEYVDLSYFALDPYAYPGIDLEPGLDGEIPADWNRLPLLSEIDLSGNRLSGSVPDSFSELQLTGLDLRDNAEEFRISDWLYEQLAASGNENIILDGIQKPAAPEPTEEPFVEPVFVEVPTEEPTPEPVIEPTEEMLPFGLSEPATEVPTEEPTPVPTQIPPTEVPTQVPPTEVPTQVPPTPQTIYVVVTATPEPRYYTSTPVPQYYFYPTATPQTYYYPQYYYPTATPQTYYYPQYYYPTATSYYQPYYVYPTATPYSYNPGWVYPTATSSYTYSYPQYGQNYQSPTQVPTQVPTADPASMLGFTYKLEAMTDNNIPMTWRYTGMSDYSINYLDASGNLYPAFAMEWTPAADICNASVCNASVSVPEELLKQGKFSLQLRVRDASGRTYVSEPVMMEVSMSQPTPTPVPEQPKSFLGGFFSWLFGPIIRLFSGK